MVFRLQTPIDDPQKRTQAVLQITDMLGLYQAELARILGINCPDIGELASARRNLEPDTGAWRQAGLLIRFYQALYDRLSGDGVAMRNWLRVEQKALQGVPHLQMVDDGELEKIVAWLESTGP